MLFALLEKVLSVKEISFELGQTVTIIRRNVVNMNKDSSKTLHLVKIAGENATVETVVKEIGKKGKPIVRKDVKIIKHPDVFGLIEASCLDTPVSCYATIEVNKTTGNLTVLSSKEDDYSINVTPSTCTKKRKSAKGGLLDVNVKYSVLDLTFVKKTNKNEYERQFHGVATQRHWKTKAITGYKTQIPGILLSTQGIWATEELAARDYDRQMKVKHPDGYRMINNGRKKQRTMVFLNFPDNKYNDQTLRMQSGVPPPPNYHNYQGHSVVVDVIVVREEYISSMITGTSQMEINFFFHLFFDSPFFDSLLHLLTSFAYFFVLF